MKKEYVLSPEHFARASIQAPGVRTFVKEPGQRISNAAVFRDYLVRDNS